MIKYNKDRASRGGIMPDKNTKIIELENIKNELLSIYNDIYKNLVFKIQDVWKSDETRLYLNHLEETADEIEKINKNIDEAISIINTYRAN